MADPKKIVKFRIVLLMPTIDCDFGLQEGHGNKYLTVQKKRSRGEDLEFNFSIECKEGKETRLAFTGPYAQGPAGQRFVYIDIGRYAGQIDTDWSRRLKIPLSGITQQQLNEYDGESQIFETRVPGTGRDGGPNCATVKPFDGWKLISG